jgi:hypothetical protein
VDARGGQADHQLREDEVRHQVQLMAEPGEETAGLAARGARTKGRQMKVRLLVPLAVAGLALAGGVAYATIPDGGVIHGCYARSGGASASSTTR